MARRIELLSLAHVAMMIGRSQSGLYAMLQTGAFPPPDTRVGSLESPRWKVATVKAWQAERAKRAKREAGRHLAGVALAARGRASEGGEE